MSQKSDERVEIPCNFCSSGTISVPKSAVTELNMTWGVCGKCKEAIRNCQICEVCHHKLFKDCDWKKHPAYGHCDHKIGEERLNHIEWGVHICNTHHKRYMRHIEAMYKEDDEDEE